MKARNRIFIMMGVLFLIALGIYYFTTPHTHGIDLVGTVDANEVIVSSRIQGRIASLDVQEGDTIIFSKYAGTEVKLDGEDVLILSERDILAIVD